MAKSTDGAPPKAGDKSADYTGVKHSEATQIVHHGRHPEAQHGFVNTPVYRGSTVLFPTLAKIKSRDQAYTYGRRATPTTHALEEAITELAGGASTILTSSGEANLPTRGQRTKTNGRTRRGKKITVGGTAKKAVAKT